MVKGCPNVGWSLGGGSVAGMDDGGNLSRDRGSVVGLTAFIALAKLKREEDAAVAMLRVEEPD
jgi:hypothetical protein